MRLLKCYGSCGGKYPKEELESHKGKNYCKDCIVKIKERDKDYDNLCAYICEIFKCPYVNPYIKKQISDFEKGGFTLKGIKSTLLYIVNVLKITLKEEYGIAMVKYQYYSAKKYAENRRTQKNQVEAAEATMVVTKYVDINKFNAGRCKKRFSLLDIDIEGEDDNE